LRSHCRPKISSRPPTITLSTPIGREVSVGPSAATIAASASVAAPTPLSADDQLRVAPTARTMVNASTASTAQARNTDSTSPISAPLMLAILPGKRLIALSLFGFIAVSLFATRSRAK